MINEANGASLYERLHAIRCEACDRPARDLRPLGLNNANICVHCAIRRGFTIKQMTRKNEP